MSAAVVIVSNAIVLYIAFLFFGGSIALFLVYGIYIAIPIALFISTVIHYAIFVFISDHLRETNRLTLVNMLARCAGLSFIAGVLPYTSGHGTPLSGYWLLEDYAASLLFYAVLLYVMCFVEWHYLKNRAVHESKV